MKFPTSPADLLARVESERRIRPNDTAPGSTPTNDIEQTIAAIWASLLGFDTVGRNDNLFNLGGDSIHITQFASRMHQRYGVTLSFTTVFNYPTVSELAGIVGQQIERTGNTAQMEPLPLRD